MKQGQAVVAGPEAQPVSELVLPDLQEALLKTEQLAAYLEELRQSGTTVAVTVKGNAQARAHGAVTLAEVGTELLAQSVHSAQLRYVYGGARWVDTLIVTPKGVRLVRMSY